MILLKKPSQNLWLWWVAFITLAIGLSIFFLLTPAAESDYNLQRYRAMALVISLMVSGLCVIIGTRGRWFGKDL